MIPLPFEMLTVLLTTKQLMSGSLVKIIGLTPCSGVSSPTSPATLDLPTHLIYPITIGEDGFRVKFETVKKKREEEKEFKHAIFINLN